MSYQYKDYFKRLHINETRKIGTDLNDKFKALDELNEVYAQAAEYKEYRADTEKLYNALKAKGEKEILKYKDIADEYEAKNKELLEELKYLNKVNRDLVWQRDTDEEHEAKAKAFDAIVEKYEGIMKGVRNRKFKVTSDVTLLGLEAEKVIKKYESGERNEYQ